MNLDLYLFIGFILVMSVFLIIKRKNIRVQGRFPWYFILMYNTTWGLKFVDWLASKFGSFFRKIMWPLVIAGITVMIAGIIAIIYTLHLSFTTTVKQGAALILPFQTASQLYVPFFYWIIAISIICIVHELAHAVMCKVNDIPIKSTGFAFAGLLGVPLLPAAFVDPDMEVLKTKTLKQQNSMLAAGSISNLIFALIFMIIFMSAGLAIAGTNLDKKSLGVEITKTAGQAESLGILPGTIIRTAEYGNRGIYITEPMEMTSAVILAQQGGYNELTINTDRGNYVFNTQEKLGITVKAKILPPQSVVGKIIQWVMELLKWLYILNLAVAITNLLPIKPLDGGHLFGNLSEKGLGKKYGTATTIIVSMIFIMIIIILFVGGI